MLIGLLPDTMKPGFPLLTGIAFQRHERASTPYPVALASRGFGTDGAVAYACDER
jgi:hypothetical protein